MSEDAILNHILISMDVVVIAAIISVAGVLVSVVATLVIGRKTLTNELIKIRASVEQLYTTRLLEERSKRYPEVYQILGELAMDIAAVEKGYRGTGKPITKARLQETKESLDSLKGHALFYSVETAYAIYNFSELLVQLIESLNDKHDELPHSVLDGFRTKISLAEMGLKMDIGIHIEESQSIRSEYTGKDYKDFKR